MEPVAEILIPKVHFSSSVKRGWICRSVIINANNLLEQMPSTSDNDFLIFNNCLRDVLTFLQVYLLIYTPKNSGLHSVNVFYEQKTVEGSPFGVKIKPS